jgi:CBS-domain-containing membrane protein
LIGHLIGALAGLGALTIFGLLHQGPALTHVSATRIGAAAISLGLTGAVMIWIGTPHPPAGATRLIVSLGFLHTPAAVGVLMIGVTLLVAQGLAVNRWAGIDYPLWGPRHLTRTTPPDGGSPAMQYTLFVDAIGDAAASKTALRKLHAVLATEAHELTCGPHEWTAIFTVAAADLEEAARILRRRVDAADAAAGLSGWHFTCYEVHETLVPLDDDAPHWHPRLPAVHWPKH